ncbi:auxin-responsive protein IAA26-like [Impatiens glandulifera]|uniref:auxin-responsive protein IAA26-like n=1 Tax=Impatiens glandulifera TaxID=253017 RepID=UPI001FB16A7F|nr:auxin-responsive protein IAA26-like [Impatiens glandulifera]
MAQINLLIPSTGPQTQGHILTISKATLELSLGLPGSSSIIYNEKLPTANKKRSLPPPSQIIQDIHHDYYHGEYSETEGYKGLYEYAAPTYQDKDGDWMLLGDVPWEMFMASILQETSQNDERNHQKLIKTLILGCGVLS